MHHDESKILQLLDMGFSRESSIEALNKFHWNSDQALDYILTSATESTHNSAHTGVAIPVLTPDGQNIAIALEESMRTYAFPGIASFEPLHPSQRCREPGVPTGLKNIGNTCYFNSLLQTYFMIPKFVQEVLKFSAHPSQLEENGTGLDWVRKRASIHLVQQLQRLFGYMVRSQRKYIDPTEVLQALVDGKGDSVQLGDQKDVGEFNMLLLERIEEGMKTIYPLAHTTAEDAPQDLAVRRKDSTLTVNELTEEGIVSGLFYGKQKERLQAVERDGAPVEVTRTEAFGQILVDVEDQDLRYAWERACFTSIEGFVTPQGHSTTASQEIWVEKLPDTLLFQLQRVKFDTKALLAEKIHAPFFFPRTIYPDWVLLENHALSSELRNELLALRSKVQLLEERIKEFQEFSGTSIPLDLLLKKVAKFLGQQHGDSAHMELVHPDLTLYSPEQLDTDPSLLPLLKAAQDLLLQYSGQSSAKVEHMQEQLRTYKAQIQGLFERPELLQKPYHLHSLLMHEGQAGSGHYYAHIYDFQCSVWRKYSDFHIAQVPEEEVLSEAVGGNGLSSAYSLVYISSELLTHGPASYAALVSDSLAAEIDQDNAKLEQEIAEHQYREVLKDIQDAYIQRYTQVTAQDNSRLSQFSRPRTIQHELINSVVFLKCISFDRITRWYLLNITVREFDAQHRGLNDLEDSDPLLALLKSEFRWNCKEAPYELKQTESEKTTLARELARFTQNYNSATVLVYVMQKLLASQFASAGHALEFYCESNKLLGEYMTLAKNLAKTLVFRLTSEVLKQATLGDLDSAMFFGWYAVEVAHRHFAVPSEIASVLKQRLFHIKEKVPGQEGQNTLFEMIKCLDNNQPLQFSDELTDLAEIEELKRRVRDFEASVWIEGWKKDCVASSFIELKNAMETEPIGLWWQISECMRHRKITMMDFTEAEEKSGILC